LTNLRPTLVRIPAVLLVVLISAISYPGAVVVSLVTRTAPAVLPEGTAPAGSLPWLRVEHPAGARPYIADPEGRLVLLHGAIPGGLIDFWSGTDPTKTEPAPHYPIDPAAYAGRCPANSATIRVPPLCQNDVSEMRALGFNVIRLALSWSLLEPQRGIYSRQYLDRVAQVVGWARAQGLYVILDIHQNAYSRYVGRPTEPPLPGGKPPGLWDYSGAPKWATYTDLLPSEVYLGQREVNPAVLEADSNFWYNRAGLQDEYIGALAAIARRFKSDSTVAGYGIFNEPWPGWNLSPGFEDLLLFPFYRRVIDALTGARDGIRCATQVFMPAPCGYPDLGIHDRRHLFFLDTGLVREITDFPTHLGLTLSAYPNLVLALHAYTHKYTFDALAGQQPDKASYPFFGYEQSYKTADLEARALGAALFVTEFGSETTEDALLLRNQLAEQEKHQVGFTFWTWKENCASGTTWGIYAGVYGDAKDQRCAYDGRPKETGVKPQSGCLRSGREALLARVYPVAVGSRDFTFSYDPSTGAFSMVGTARPQDPDSVVVIPPEVTGAAAGGDLINAPNGFRTLTLHAPSGRFALSVAAAPLRLANCK